MTNRLRAAQLMRTVYIKKAAQEEATNWAAKQPRSGCEEKERMVGVTGLEPATSLFLSERQRQQADK